MSVISDKIPIINVVNVNVLDNPTSATNPFQFEIIFEACKDLEDGKGFYSLISNLDLEWKMTYVGDYRSVEKDQILDSILVGPINRGTHKFCFQVCNFYFLLYSHFLQANAPDFSRVPEDCLVGVTVLLITCCYHNQEFIRIGYYVCNNLDTPMHSFSDIQRQILADQPRVTHTPIDWE